MNQYQMAYLRHATLAFEVMLCGWISKAKALLPFLLLLSATSQECCEKEVHDLLRTSHQVNLTSWATRRRRDHGRVSSVQATGDLTHLPSHRTPSSLFPDFSLLSTGVPPNLSPSPFPWFSLSSATAIFIFPLSSPHLSLPPHILGGKEERQGWDK